MALGTVAPVVATGWALGAAYNRGSDTTNFSSSLSKDAPSVEKPLGVGRITGALALLALPMTHFGRGVVSKIVAGTYNAGLSGTAAFGSSAIFSPSQNPGLSGTLAGGATAMGTGFKSLVPGPAGIFMNQIIQVAPGSLQKAIENQKDAKK